MTNNDIPNQTSPLYNVQPASHTSEKRIFPSLPYTSENLKFIIKFNFQFSDLTDSEYITLCNMLLKYKTSYATHKNDGKISTPSRIRFKPNAQLMTQRPSKAPIHYRDKLNILLKELEKYNIIKQIGSSPQDKPVYGTTYFSYYPLIIIPKGDTIKCVLDARHLNSNTEQSDESWPIEPLAPQLARANKKYNSAFDLMYAYAHTPLDEDTIKLTSFSSGDKLFAFIRGFYGLKGLPNFFTKQMSTFFKTLIEQGFALVYGLRRGVLVRFFASFTIFGTCLIVVINLTNSQGCLLYLFRLIVKTTIKMCPSRANSTSAQNPTKKEEGSNHLVECSGPGV